MYGWMFVVQSRRRKELFRYQELNAGYVRFQLKRSILKSK